MQITLALLPIFILIVIGNAMRRLNFPGDQFWSPAEKFLYYFLFPAMLVNKLTYASREGLLLDKLFYAIALAFIVGTVMLWGMQRWIKWSGPTFTSIYQGGIRFNSYVGLAAAQSLMGDQGLAIAALMMSIMIPLLNLLCIGNFALYAKQAQPGWRGIAKAIATNPLIVGSLAGLLFNTLGIRFPDTVDQVLDLVGNMALPMGLLCVGAALNLKALSNQGSSMISATLFKLILFPWVFVGAGMIVGLPDITLTAFAILGALPTATASYILARQLGGDAPLMAAMISGQTLLAMASMPLMIPLLQWWINS
ncbi:transporter [Hahella sp. CCB-MM4]|uniref:AEC family transporter n=1 Tax=Hahella sp. (strain CCB-MM4) TaxID=1926491 RepID=UPI000B9AF576|nr:AEC family transporter [Hahella sp. CCB-MM4]OZG74566.1 transporter [Hahella sp. CCB-MM4]